MGNGKEQTIDLNGCFFPFAIFHFPFAISSQLHHSVDGAPGRIGLAGETLQS
jgi:hypothetical protein